MVNLIIRELEDQRNTVDYLVKDNKRLRRSNKLLTLCFVLGAVACVDYLRRQHDKIENLETELFKNSYNEEIFETDTDGIFEESTD